MSDKQNILNFIGTGVIDGREVSVNFKASHIDFDQSDKSNPLLIVKLLPFYEDKLYEIKLENEVISNQEHIETYEESQTYINQIKESDLKSGELF